MRRLLQLLVAASVAACTGGLAERSVVSIEGRLLLPATVRELRIEIENGRVEVRPASPEEGVAPAVRFRGAVRRAGDTVEQLRVFEARGTELTVAADLEKPGVFVLRAPTRPPDQVGGVLAVEVRLELPGELPLQVLIDGSGDLVVEDRIGATELDTHRGDVRLMRCTGAAKIHSGYGTIIVYDHRGDLDVETGVGEMQIFVREPGSRLRLINGMGNIQCLIPPDAGFRADARTKTGKLANGFGLPIERPSAYSAAMVGQRGDGHTEIVMRTGKGHLSLSHKTFD